MNCIYCKDTGKYKKPNDIKEFDRLVELEMFKGDFVNQSMAEKKAYQKVGFTTIDCPYCNLSKKEKMNEKDSNAFCEYVIDKDYCPDIDNIITKIQCSGCEYYKGFKMYLGQPCIICSYYAGIEEAEHSDYVFESQFD